MSDSQSAWDARAWAVAKARRLYRIGRAVATRGRPEQLEQSPLPTQVRLRSAAPGPARRALLSYIVHPFVLPPDHPDRLRFSNIGLAICIAETLQDMGFDVDVIDNADVTYRSDETYDLVLVHGGVNFESLLRNLLGDAKLVYFSTGSHWAFHNEAEVRRFADLRARRGIDLPLDRYIRHSEARANVLADQIVCLGNESARETYARYPSVIALNNAASPDKFYGMLSKDFDAGRRRFLYFGSVGNVHKGLDLLLEAFTGLDADLYICGTMEPEFRTAFARELALPTVHDMCWVELRSATFYELMSACNCAILPSASEGQPGGIVECMHRGLIPIVSRETHVDVRDHGIVLPDCSVGSIRAVVTEVMARPASWHEAASAGTYQEAITDFTPEVFHSRFRDAMEAVLEAPGKPRRYSLAPQKLLSSAAGVAMGSKPSSAGPKVAIDAVFFQWNTTGIARVWDSLLKEWSRNGFGSRVVVLDRAGTAPRYPGLSYAAAPAYPAGGDMEADREVVEAVCRRSDAGVFASTYYTFPQQTPSVFVAYDMIPEVTGMNLAEEDWQRKHKAIQHASGFVAISQSTADDLVRYFPEIHREEIAVAHCGVSDAFFVPPRDEVQAFRAGYGLPDYCYLFVGSRTYYKNCGLLMEAFASMDERERCGLFLVGGAPVLEADFAGFAKGRAVVMAALGDEELRLAYGAATSLVFPSRYEGFGLPPLEAMASGCPVITCANSSIPEVVGDAVIYVDDSDPRELADAMIAVRDIALRRRLVDAGLARARGFSWARMADAVQSEFERVVHRSSGRSA
jgi:glycosyltransferase involved in cell wall biosynthesis